MFTCDESIRLVESIISVVCLLSIKIEGWTKDDRISVRRGMGGLILGMASIGVELVPNKGKDGVRIFKLTFYKS